MNFLLSYFRFIRDLKYQFSKKIYLTSHGFKMWFHKEPEDKGILPTIETDLVTKYKDEFDVFFDVGAFVGFFSMFANSMRKNVKYIAFEPQIDSFKLLKKNFLINHVEDYHLFNLALSDKKNISKLYGFGQGASLVKNWGGITNYTKSVNVDILDNFYHLIPKNESKIFLKIDAEGREYQILMGGKKFLNHNVKIIIYFENSISRNFEDKNPYFLKIYKLLIENSFKIFHESDLNKNLTLQDLENFYNTGVETTTNINYLAIKN